jgi:hypothetical protein
LVKQLIEVDSKKRSLLKTLRFHYISSDLVLDYFHRFPVDELDYDLFQNLIQQIFSSSIQQNQSIRQYRNQQKITVYEENEKLRKEIEKSKNEIEQLQQENVKLKTIEIPISGYNGIISELRKATSNSVVVTCSSEDSSSDKCQNVLNHDDNSRFCSKSIENSWICFEFINKKVLLSAYLLRHQIWNDSYVLRNWKVEGSNDNVNWFMIDKKENDQSLHQTLQEATFQCQPPSPCSFIKITQIGKNSANDLRIFLNFVEFSGKVFEKQNLFS